MELNYYAYFLASMSESKGHIQSAFVRIFTDVGENEEKRGRRKRIN